MPYTFKQLQDQLASLCGAEDVTDLVDSDIQHVKDVINQCYVECYTPIDGRRPRWTEREYAWSIPTPTQVDITAIDNSRTITFANAADEPGADFLGSYIDIGSGGASTQGSSFYTLGKRVSSTEYELVEPFAGPTGVTSAAVHYNARTLDASAVDITEAPELVGQGLLSPMAGKETELAYRAFLKGDFTAGAGRGYGRTINLTFSGTEYERGTPIFYYANSSQLVAGEPLKVRFVLYPLPGRDFRISIRANVIPTLLDVDADEPVLPFETVVSVLLPMARAKFAMVSRRYNGDNRAYLEKDDAAARQRLKSFSQPQKRRNTRVRVRRGF